jgi:glycine amidinotransferase
MEPSVADPQVEAQTAAAPRVSECPVNSYNEWDPLQEVIVGRLDYATIPNNHVLFTQSLPRRAATLYRPIAGRRYPRAIVEPAQRELDEFVRILEAEGVTVRRPGLMDFSRSFGSPYWKARGFCTASPRDGLLVIGDMVIETPMAWRSRYFEIQSYHELLQDYWRRGARWVSAPKPRLADSLYDYGYSPPGEGEAMRYIINESEIVFDAADFVRCGLDLFVTKSNVTNYLGIEWLQRFLGEKFRIHEIETRCRQPMHIDTTFMPLAPGKVLVNPEFIDIDRLPPILKSWDVLVAPQPDSFDSGWRFYLSMVSKWISVNVLMFDEKRVVVEKSQVSMIAKLKDWGFEPIPCPFMNYKMFGGGFHCATLDIRREGTLESYF